MNLHSRRGLAGAQRHWRSALVGVLANAWLTVGLVAHLCADEPLHEIGLTLELDRGEVSVADPLLARITLSNSADHVVRIPGVIPTIECGRMGIQFRQAGQQAWNSFRFAHVTVDPGFAAADAMLELRPKQQLITYECIAYQTVVVRGIGPLRDQILPALDEAGDYEFRAQARIGDLVLVSPVARIRARERSEAQLVAIDLGQELLQKAARLHRPGLEHSDRDRSEKLQTYLGNTSASRLLKWKSAWATWVEADDLIRPPAARDLLISMRDSEKGIAREVLTASLARGYLETGHVLRAKAEAELLPVGSADRQLVLRRIAEKARQGM